MEAELAEQSAEGPDALVLGADGRLRAQEEYHETNGTPYLLHERRGYFSEYRYDALGRRVMVRTRRDGLCYKASTTIADCTGGITRYVWSGDNLLWEMRGPGADSTFPGALDDISASPAEFGVVGYTHAGGVDRPLVVWKGMGANTSVVVVPHMNWRGLFGRGTNSSGGATTVAIEWTGFQTTAYHSFGPSQESTTNWMGSLIEGQRDPGGGMYMRNRYYDPATGQFTQTDPIGIAGGLNTYGFANGDPVSYSDPYGLSGCNWLRRPLECAALRLHQEMSARGHNVTMTEARYYVRNPLVMGIAAGVVAETGGFVTEIEAEFAGVNGVGNAARHIYGQCLMTLRSDAETAQKVGDLHEAENAPDDPDSTVDQENNERGRALAGNYPQASRRNVEATGQREQHCASGARALISSGNFSRVGGQ